MYLVTIGEIFLKGENRITFERKLMRNMRFALDLKPDEIQRHRNRYLILNDENINQLQTVFGVNSYSKTIKCNPDEIKETALSLIKNEKTFRVSSKTIQLINKNSIELNNEIGEYIIKNKDIKVNLENPEINIRIEEISGKIYLYTEIIKGPGGLPVGCSGYVYIRVKDELKASVAAYLMMKRGCKIYLSSDLPLMHKFAKSFKLKVREEYDNDFIVTDETFENIDLKENQKFILKPLIGYSEEEINKIYNKIVNINSE